MGVLKHAATCCRMPQWPEFSRWLHTATLVSCCPTDFPLFVSFPHFFDANSYGYSTTEGSQKPVRRNKEITRSTADCLQWAIGERILQHVCLMNSQGESQTGKLHCTFCAVWLSVKGAILEDHVFGESMKQSDGLYARKPGSHAHKAAAQPLPSQAPEAAPQQLPTIIVNVPAAQPNLHHLPRKREHEVPLICR